MNLKVMASQFTKGFIKYGDIVLLQAEVHQNRMGSFQSIIPEEPIIMAGDEHIGFYQEVPIEGVPNKLYVNNYDYELSPNYDSQKTLKMSLSTKGFIDSEVYFQTMPQSNINDPIPRIVNISDMEFLICPVFDHSEESHLNSLLEEKVHHLTQLKHVADDAEKAAVHISQLK